jgi:lipooligosaccharide transport system permease protein
MTAVALPTTSRRRAARWTPPQVTARALHIWRRNRDVYMNVWRSELIWPIIEPLVTLLALGLGLGTFVELESGEDYINFVGPALIAVFSMWTATAECGWGSYTRMDSQGAFDAALATPVSVDEVTTGEIIWGATRSILGVFYIMVMVTIMGGIDSPMALLIFPLALLPGVMFSAISLAYTAVAKSVSSLNYFFATYVTPQFWLSGAFFPLGELPGWVSVVAWFTPAYHVVRIYRAMAAGDLELDHLIDVGWVLVVTLVAYLVAITMMRRRLIK